MSATREPGTQQKRSRLIALCLGNSLAYYDLVIFSTLAVQISGAIFPAGDRTAALMQTLGLMGVAYVSRPLGAIVLGRLSDRAGRKQALLLSFLLAGVATLGQALVPAYADVGVLAPIAMLGFRLLLGFAIGGEFGASTAMLVEAAPTGRRGWFVALQLAGQDVGAVVAGLVAALLAISLTPSELGGWGWRVALLVGGGMIPLGLFLRARIEETLSDMAAPDAGARALVLGRPQILAILLLLAALFVADGIKYLGIYAQTVLGLEPKFAFGATITIAASGIMASLVGGLAADRIGRRPVVLAGLSLVTLGVVPAFWWLNASASLGTLVTVSGLLACTFAFASPAIVTMLAEVMPARGRATALAIVAAGGVAVINGTADLFNTWIIAASGDPLAPAWAMTLIGIAAVAIARALSETAPGRRAPRPFSRADTVTV